MEKLFRKYYQPLCYFADELLHDSILSEETVQDTFVRIVSSRQRNVRVDIINESESIIAPESDSSDYSVVRAELIRMIREAIASLPSRYRQVFIMSYIDGMKNEEIAVALGISINTVKVMRRREKARMREMLRDLFPLVFIFAREGLLS